MEFKFIEDFMAVLVSCKTDEDPIKSEVQGSPFITPCLGSIELDRVISELCYKGIILYRNFKKMTIWEPRPGHVVTKTVL